MDFPGCRVPAAGKYCVKSGLDLAQPLLAIHADRGVLVMEPEQGNGPVDMNSLTIHASGSVVLQTARPGFHDVSGELARWLGEQGAGDGLLNVFIAHTSASLTIQENADPAVLKDLWDALDRAAPRDHPYRHASEGPDDMPSHIRSMITSVSLSIPVRGGQMALGTWQGVYLIEHRDAPHRRRIELDFTGSRAAG